MVSASLSRPYRANYHMLPPLPSPPSPVHYKDGISEEERAITELDRRIREMEARINRQRKGMGG